MMPLSPSIRAEEFFEIPLPEHPRPDFERVEWVNLNGSWGLRFDAGDVGRTDAWQANDLRSYSLDVTVPFSWGSPLSGVLDGGDIAWYARTLRVPQLWKGKRVFLCIGAADWHTTAWLAGEALGEHRGGYTPFEFELTDSVSYEQEQLLVLRIDDGARPAGIETSEDHGSARGIWQTIYLEARTPVYVDKVHFHSDIDGKQVTVRVGLSDPAPSGTTLRLRFRTREVPDREFLLPEGAQSADIMVSVPTPRLWSLEDPFLYEADVLLELPDGVVDRVQTYFGMRKISVTELPGSGYPYVALNNRPLYLQMALDRSYHPDGFFTLPSDDFIKEEILRTRRLGLNAVRIADKIAMPRKLYWADRLGLLVMAAVPGSSTEPEDATRRATETALRDMIKRDFNHPSVFSWAVFNGTRGLERDSKGYPAETQTWRKSMYLLAKKLDPTRLVEDTATGQEDHVATDINSWHAHLPGHAWAEELDDVIGKTFSGSKWNFIGGRTQDDQPLLNSGAGNFWGYDGSAGDVDWTWDYHLVLNALRRHPRVCGWLYAGHHDGVRQWDGYLRLDRSAKITGFAEIFPEMRLNDLHSEFYLAPDVDLCVEGKPGEKISVPLWASFLTASYPGSEVVLRTLLYGWDDLGRAARYAQSSQKIEFEPWMSRAIDPVEVVLPGKPALAILCLSLEDLSGRVLHRNFTSFLVADAGEARTLRDVTRVEDGRKVRIVRFAPSKIQAAEWSLSRWDVLDGLKVCGAGAGYFEYRIDWPAGLDPELSAKQLYSKDRRRAWKPAAGRSPRDPTLSLNAYPMTDALQFPSSVRIRIAGEAIGVHELQDDPADHRGILSWHAQKRDRRLRDAGSYGYLVSVMIPHTVLVGAAEAGEIRLRLEVDEATPGGLAVYGERFGRYPLDPTLAFVMKR
jgi:hypothetical protein